MKVKIISGNSTKEVEREINDFFSDRKDVKVIDIREIASQKFYIFMVLYEIA